MQARRIEVIQITMDETETQVMAGIMAMAVDSDHTSGAYSQAEQTVAREWLTATETTVTVPQKGYR